MSLRNTVASWLVRRAPELIYYRAQAHSRAGLRVRRNGSTLDIIRPKTRRMIRISNRNAVYIVDMVEYFDFYFGAVTPDTVEIAGATWEVVDFSAPRPQQVTGFTDFKIFTPSVAEPFGTVQQYLDFAELKPGGTALDLGGYSGLTGIAFSKAVGPTGKIIVVEPDPINHAAAETNIAAHGAINGLSNIRLVQAAAGPENGFMDLSSEGSMGSAAISVVGDYRGESVRVPSYTLDDFLQLENLDRLDFIKMDIEGSEEPLLRASGDFLKRYKPRLIIEPHFVGGVRSDGPLTSVLEGFGYQCRTVDQEGSSLPLIQATPAL